MTQIQLIIAQIRECVAQGDLKTAITLLIDLLKDTHLNNQALQIAGRYNNAEQQINMGLVDTQTANLTQNQIRAAILSVLSEVEEKGNQKESRSTLPEQSGQGGQKNVVNNSNITAGGNVHIGDNHTTNHIIQYPNRKIPTILTPATASVPATFLGREQELEDIRNLLCSQNTIALINSEGGMGKTTVAARYWNQYANQYMHRAWLFCEGGIMAAIRNQLPAPLGIVDALNPYGDKHDEIALVIKGHLANLDKDCLLVLDNANEASYITEFLRLMNGLGWHVLLTSRCQKVLPSSQNEYQIKSLPPDLAKKLFTDNYTEDSTEFDALLDRFLLAVGYNTLCIEIFSKNLRAGGSGDWDFSFADFLQHLQKGGLKLGDNSINITTDYTKNVKSPAATSDQIIEALYNLKPLEPAETDLLLQFSLLPAEKHTAKILRALLTHESPTQLKKDLDNLAQKGWLAADIKAYRVSPVVQKIVLHQQAHRRWELGEAMVKKLHFIFETEGFHSKNIDTAGPFAALVFGLVDNLDVANEDVAMLFYRLWVYYHATGNIALALDAATRMQLVSVKYGDKNYLAIAYQNLGNTHTSLGNLELALKFYEDYNKLEQELHSSYPTNMDYKNGLAITYQYLGNTHTSLGNFELALQFYEDQMRLSEELYANYTTNVDYKNGLAVSYQYLGNTHNSLGNLEPALKFYKGHTRLFEELYTAYPTNLDYKNGLAISYLKLGNTHTALGNLELALQFYEECNRLEKELNTDSTTNVEYKNNLAISYQYLGITHTTLGNFEPTLQFYEDYNRLVLELHTDYPTIVKYKNNLAASYSKLGETHASLGNLELALQFYVKNLAISEELYVDYPTDVDYKNNLAISYQNLGITHTSLGNLELALQFYESYNQLERELHITYPTKVDYKNNLAISCLKLGETHTSLGNLELALQFYEDYNQLKRELHTDYPTNVGYKNGLAVSYFNLGQFCVCNLSDKIKAQEYYKQAEALWLELVRDAPKFVQFQKFLVMVQDDIRRLG